MNKIKTFFDKNLEAITYGFFGLCASYQLWFGFLCIYNESYSLAISQFTICFWIATSLSFFKMLNDSLKLNKQILEAWRESTEGIKTLLDLKDKTGDIDLSPDDEALRPSTSPPKEGKEGKPY